MRARVGGRVFLGGQSYGGRQASILAAEETGVAAALLLLAYPLHPPRRRSDLRTAHFSTLRTPALFVSGSRDPFGSPEELEAARYLVSAATTLLLIDGAGHDLARTPRRSVEDVAAEIAIAFLTFAG
jgi:predicted alpha/beta-hydrolase family hydrolase